jgi:MYXO-CTERM domain-containing protein
MKPKTSLRHFLALAASLLMAGLSSAATTITFESPYTIGTIAAATNGGTTNSPFNGQQGWSRSTSNNVGNIIASTTSGSYTGGQALTASTSGTTQTYIGANAVGAFTSYTFDFRYYTVETGVGGWNDVNNDGLFDQTETQFQAGVVAIGAINSFGIRFAGFASTGGDSNSGKLSTGTSGTNGDWYRMTVNPDFATTTVTLGVFNLTTNTAVTLGTSVFNLTSAQFGVDPTTYEGVVARVTSDSPRPSAIDNITLIPEPSAALLGGLGMLALLRRRR